MPVAHAIFWLSRRCKNNIAGGRVDGINIGHAFGGGKLAKVFSSDVDFTNVIIMINVFAIGKNNAFAVGRQFRIAHHAIQCFENYIYSARSQFQYFKCTAGDKAGSVDFTGLKYGCCVMMVPRVLPS